MKLLKTSIFLFAVVAMAVGTGTVLSQGSEPAAEPAPTPEPSGQPVKTLVTVTTPGAAVEVSQASAPNTPPASSPPSGNFYNPPAPKSYTPGNYQTPAPASGQASQAGASYYSGIPQPNMLNYAAVPNAAPGAAKTSTVSADTQPAASSPAPAASNPSPSSATTTINIPTDGNVSTGVSIVGSQAFGFADVTQYTSHPGSTTGSVDISVGITQ